ncbi:ribonuclease HI large subunit [Niveomyces insectorum RCEF 264]|uniref:Ribonuclease n=1 Tax=Niveomyces insectorum RCEF 264 TaxID=1081102 RepID=A0A162MUH6_9HYPO|nr:ribonuclease HI large subunit [Niveomyces insectorum RCEF 264]
MDEDVPMDEEVNLETTPLSGEFVPPSIDESVLLSGASYSYYSPVPPRLLASSTDTTVDPSPSAATATSTSTPAPTPPTPPTPPIPTPTTTSSVPCVLGVDEAGRGPVLGPMVYGVFYAPVDEADALLRGASPDADKDADGRPFRFDDSKVLSAATRAALLASVCRPGAALHRTCGWAVTLLSARDIGADMLAPVGGGGNLNAQAADATVGLIRGVLARGVHVTDVFVDTVGPPAAYQAKLARVFPGLRITVSKKADSLYPCVSAASVCAKVTRDVALEVLYKPYAAAGGHANGNNNNNNNNNNNSNNTTRIPSWGSGYPSDARCTTWLRRNMHPVFGWGPECRFSWGTAKDLLEDKKSAVRVEWPTPDDDDTDENGWAVGRMTDFFAASAAGGTGGSAQATDELTELGAWFGRPVGLEAF